MDESACLLGSAEAGKQLLDLQSIHQSANMELVHCAREAAYAGAAAAKLAASTQVDAVKDAANVTAGAAKHTEILARKLACQIGLPVMTGEPFLPTLARTMSVALPPDLALTAMRRVVEFI